MYDNITDVTGLKVGVVTDEEAVTGCTVILAEKGVKGGVSVRGGGPGTRETDILSPFCRAEEVHGIALSGGSAFGLGVACGVMRYLEEKGCGLNVGTYRVPIVPGAIIFDLSIGNGKIRPDASWGYRAAVAASQGLIPEGSVGAGTGATIGKALGLVRAVKGGQASLSCLLPNGLVVGVLVVVNALGDVIDEKGGLLAGPRDPEKGGMHSTLELFQKGEWMLGRGRGKGLINMQKESQQNTTLAVVATNADLSKPETNRVAAVAHNGLAAAIRPLHTSWDGDTVFALATGEKPAPVDLVGAVGADLLAQAVRRAVYLAEGLGGVPAYKDLVLSK